MNEMCMGWVRGKGKEGLGHGIQCFTIIVRGWWYRLSLFPLQTWRGSDLGLEVVWVRVKECRRWKLESFSNPCHFAFVWNTIKKNYFFFLKAQSPVKVKTLLGREHSQSEHFSPKQLCFGRSDGAADKTPEENIRKEGAVKLRGTGPGVTVFP